MLITDTGMDGDALTFTGNSLGSSLKEIKSAKKDEPPVIVSGRFQQREGIWKGSLQQG